MAVIRPFRAVRPVSEYAPRTAALPYDVYHREEAYAAALKDRLSFLNIDRPETQFPPDYDMYAPEVYRKAGELLRAQMGEGIYRQDEQPSYYLYELTMDGRKQTGLVACASIDDYISGVIKKHENTREEKELDRIRHVDACDMQTGPIFLAYRADPVIRTITQQMKETDPVFEFVSEDGIGHRGWVIDDAGMVQKIENTFRTIQDIYIADGHHRAASAVKVGELRRKQNPDYTGEEEFNYFLSILFPDEDLMIMDYNRVVRDLAGRSEEEFLEEIRKSFRVSPLNEAARPPRKGTFTMLLGGKWYLLEADEDVLSDDPVEGLDVSLLQREVLDRILGIKDPRTDQRVDFIGGIRGLKELERLTENGWSAAFAVYPVSMDQLFRVADAGLLMPPKSTWFEPKLRSGLFFHDIRNE